MNKFKYRLFPEPQFSFTCDKCKQHSCDPFYYRPRNTYNSRGMLVALPKNTYFKLCVPCFKTSAHTKR